jgi:fructuronate reductase
MSTAREMPTLGPSLLGALAETVRVPGYDRAALLPGMAHIGVGAFHRCHQAEYTDDLLALEPDRWGVVGINIREPRLSSSLARQSGLYTRLCRENDRVEARIVGSIVATVDSQDSPDPALKVLASPEIDVVTMTVTEKGYCHAPSTGRLDLEHPDIVHDLAEPQRPRSLPGILARALEMRMQTHGRPVTLLSCDNIPANGKLLSAVVSTIAEQRGAKLADWIAANIAFPSAMVDRIAPATTRQDAEWVEANLGYRDDAVAVGEPFRQWVIEKRFAGRFPRWDRVGATFVDEVEPFEHLKMRVLNGAQSTLSYLGALAGLEHTYDDIADPLLEQFVRRMLLEETLPTLQPVPGISHRAYVEQSLDRLRNTAIRHRNRQIATDGSQKIVQRLLNPISERLRKGLSVELLTVPVAAWMAYLIRSSKRFGNSWNADDPFAARVAQIADRIGNDAALLADEMLAIDAIFTRELAGHTRFRALIARHLDGMLSPDPMPYLRRLCESKTAGCNG